MSIKGSYFSDDKWHVWENAAARARGSSHSGLFVEATIGEPVFDEWGHPDLEVSVHGVAINGHADVSLFLPRAVCEAIAKWVKDNDAAQLEAEKAK
jgi:hypothetical protein